MNMRPTEDNIQVIRMFLSISMYSDTVSPLSLSFIKLCFVGSL